jgi:hypothetical protein
MELPIALSIADEIDVTFSVENSVEIADAEALRGDVCSPVEMSPAVAPPDAVADLRNVIISLRFVEDPDADALAVRGAVCSP